MKYNQIMELSFQKADLYWSHAVLWIIVPQRILSSTFPPILMSQVASKSRLYKK